MNNKQKIMWAEKCGMTFSDIIDGEVELIGTDKQWSEYSKGHDRADNPECDCEICKLGDKSRESDDYDYKSCNK